MTSVIKFHLNSYVHIGVTIFSLCNTVVELFIVLGKVAQHNAL